MPDRMPVYRLSSEEPSVSRLTELGRGLFKLDDHFQLGTIGRTRQLRNGHHVVEIAGESGGVWATDESQLWNPTLRPHLIPEKQAVAQAEKTLRDLSLLPTLAQPFHLGPPSVGGTRLALRQGTDAKRETHHLDTQVTYPVLVNGTPVIGGGGDFKITLGDQGRVIGYSGVWRHAERVLDAAMLDRKKADEQFRSLTEKMELESFDASLAYYSAPAFRRQEFLYPVYVYRATAKFGKQRVPLRQIVLPATEFGPPIERIAAQPPRRKPAAMAVPRRRTRAASSDAGKGVPRRGYGGAAALVAAPTRPWEAGTSWIGLSGGLSGSQANAQGFVDEWAAAGWHIDFNWGDTNAWESDWTSNDDNYVDNADFVFYTGHANMNGWVLAKTGGDGWLDFSETGAAPGNPGDLWGQSDLEWAIIAACGPLQDDLIAPGGGDVFQRWDGAFDGMHILLGYGAITFDNTDEGRKVSQYAKSGRTIIDSWFRAAQEIQPATNGASAPDGPNVWVGAMWVGKPGADPANDHAWDFGSVSADPKSPTWYTAMWTTC
jgi:hypothetical protein